MSAAKVRLPRELALPVAEKLRAELADVCERVELAGSLRERSHKMPSIETIEPLITLNDRKRFWKKVDIRGPDECWLWSGAVCEDGYGTFRIHGKVIGSHILSRYFATGVIPLGLCTCHDCPSGDNPSCCNPSHLFLGTHSDNMKDMIRKGRGNKATGDRNGSRVCIDRMRRGANHPSRLHPERMARGDKNGARTKPESRTRGEKCWASKLTPEKVLEIRKLISDGVLSNPEIGKIFGVSKTAIRSIATGKTWKHL